VATFITVMNSNVVTIGATEAHLFFMEDPSISHGVVVHRLDDEEFCGFLPPFPHMLLHTSPFAAQ
jgi:hypothetical protein